MQEAIRNMLDRYECRTRDDYARALREILQEVALLGLWRSKFFEHAAFYGGTALRILYGLDRYSEDLDFSLLAPDADFSVGAYGDALRREMSSFGFEVDFEDRLKARPSAIDSAFLKTNTYRQLIAIGIPEDLMRDLHPAKTLKIRLEVDTDPPGGFETETRYVLQPIPFSVRSYSLPDLFAGKLHAILCRKWKTRVKGRDWYDLIWFISRFPEVRLSHLEERMRQSGDYENKESLTSPRLQAMLGRAVEELDVDQARGEVAPFVRDQGALEVWSKDFFSEIMRRVVPV
ncbi:nucleotidyl transferase AbiEii/AbiGii toxin family protein [Candidatus Eisenbacteria bacterium]|uniref:Nucleotidyl transferase AbiEii/AbiGii toxin family protein n=1 Tax=Eiseniibacteriota bacterium TaxID=2212470 RepID=A0ABV6YML3_UNCEI